MLKGRESVKAVVVPLQVKLLGLHGSPVLNGGKTTTNKKDFQTNKNVTNIMFHQRNFLAFPKIFSTFSSTVLGNDLRSKDFSSVSKLTKERPALLIFGLVFGSRSGSYFNSLKERKTFYEKVCLVNLMSYAYVY